MLGTRVAHHAGERLDDARLAADLARHVHRLGEQAPPVLESWSLRGHRRFRRWEAPIVHHQIDFLTSRPSACWTRRAFIGYRNAVDLCRVDLAGWRPWPDAYESA